MAFVVSAGRLEAVSQPVMPAYPATSHLSWTGDMSVEYAELYRAQPNLRTVVSFLARNIAQLGIHVFRRVSDTDRERLTDHPLARLLAHPAPPEMRLTRYRMIERLVSDLAIYDNAYWAKVRPDDGPVGYLVPIPPGRVTPLGDSWLAVDGWRIHGSRGDIDLPAEAVVHFRGYNPDDARLGLSPMETLRELLLEEWEAGQARQQMWRNGARTSGVIQRPADAPSWSPQAKASFKADWHAQFTGDGPQAGGTPILEDGMTYVSAGLDPKAAQYIEARKLSREEVAAAYHIPLPMVGILEHATYSNIQEQHKQLYADTLGPWLIMISEEISLQLMPDVADTDDLYVEFNIAEKMRGSFDEQAAALSTLTGRPVMTANEGRARLNLPEHDDGDGLVVPLNVLLGGQASPRDSAPPPEPVPASSSRRRVKARVDSAHVDHATRVLSEFFDRQGRSVASRLSAKTRGKADPSGVFDVDRWNRELARELQAINRLLATTAGRKTLARLGFDPDDYDEDRTIAWLQANADGIAAATNTVTMEHLADALDDDEDPKAAVRHLFEVYASARAAQLAVSQTTAMAGWGSTEAARQRGGTHVKTWIAGSNPRSSHVAMNGETVPVGEAFSNGGQYPGDPALPEDERAGCNCSLEIQEA